MNAQERDSLIEDYVESVKGLRKSHRPTFYKELRKIFREYHDDLLEILKYEDKLPLDRE